MPVKLAPVMDFPEFQADLSSLGATRLHLAQSLHAELVTAWSSKSRAYHNLQHLQECLELAGQAAMQLDRKDFAVLRLALWFHDAVYDSQSRKNEELSAGWARRALAELGLGMRSCMRVTWLVLSTKHFDASVVAQEVLTDWLHDIDLSILGAKPSRFDEYCRQIDAEYAWVPSLEYHQARRRVLEGFLRKAQEGRLYKTQYLGSIYERAAVANLQRVLNQQAGTVAWAKLQEQLKR